MTRLSVSIGYMSMLLLMTPLGFGQATVPHAAEVKKYLEQAATTSAKGEAPRRGNASIPRHPEDRSGQRGSPGQPRSCCNGSGCWAGAGAELQKALKLQPSHWKVQALLGLCDLHLGRLPEATKLLSGSFLHLEDPKLRLEAGLQLVEVWYQSGEQEKASTVLSQLQQLYPADAAVLYAAYRLHSDLAFQAIDSLALAAPDSLQLHRALAEHMVNEGGVQEAIAEYRKALENSK